MGYLLWNTDKYQRFIAILQQTGAACATIWNETSKKYELTAYKATELNSHDVIIVIFLINDSDITRM